LNRHATSVREDAVTVNRSSIACDDAPALRCRPRATRGLAVAAKTPADRPRAAAPRRDVPEQDLADAFHRFVDDQRERWQAEARAGREQLEAIPMIFELRVYDAAGNAIGRRSYPDCAER
jgi:hypothetical protein